MKTNEVIREMDQNQPKTLDIRDILDSMPDRNQEGVIVRKFDKMPLVFVAVLGVFGGCWRLACLTTTAVGFVDTPGL